MSKKEPKNRTNMWLVIGVLVLIALLLIWLTIADLFGDTDVAACVTPSLSAITQVLPL